MADPQMRRDVEAALAARRELGPDYDDQVAAGLAARIDELVPVRIADQRVVRSEREADREDERAGRTHRFVLGIISLGAGIPVTAISSGSVVMTAVAWAGIVGVNVAAAWGARRRR